MACAFLDDKLEPEEIPQDLQNFDKLVAITRLIQNLT